MSSAQLWRLILEFNLVTSHSIFSLADDHHRVEVQQRQTINLFAATPFPSSTIAGPPLLHKYRQSTTYQQPSRARPTLTKTMAPQAGDAMSPPIKLGPPQRLRKHTRHISDMESESEFGDFPKDQDRDVLLEEEEREKLLSKGWFGSLGKQEGGVKIGKWTKGRRRLQGLGRRIFRRNEEDSGNEDEAERFFDKDEPEYKVSNMMMEITKGPANGEISCSLGNRQSNGSPAYRWDY